MEFLGGLNSLNTKLYWVEGDEYKCSVGGKKCTVHNLPSWWVGSGIYKGNDDDDLYYFFIDDDDYSIVFYYINKKIS